MMSSSAGQNPQSMPDVCTFQQKAGDGDAVEGFA
jgi:hypothetical protein